jgi:heme-degrading monooxygenase HmoA
LIARLWHGWASAENADAYERLLEDEVIPDIDRIDGYCGAYLLRRKLSEAVEFVTLTFFESQDALRAFAGDDFEAAVIHEEAGRLLSRYDQRSAHYDIVLEPSRLGQHDGRVPR